MTIKSHFTVSRMSMGGSPRTPSRGSSFQIGNAGGDTRIRADGHFELDDAISFDASSEGSVKTGPRTRHGAEGPDCTSSQSDTDSLAGESNRFMVGLAPPPASVQRPMRTVGDQFP